jgi:hypothetical protein
MNGFGFVCWDCGMIPFQGDQFCAFSGIIISG